MQSKGDFGFFAKAARAESNEIRMEFFRNSLPNYSAQFAGSLGRSPTKAESLAIRFNGECDARRAKTSI
jgi:hypothetical protein